MISHLRIFISQIYALLIKDLKLKSRYKLKFIFAIIIPFTTFIVPLLIFRKLFEASGNEPFGIWTSENYMIFILSGIFIVILMKLLPAYGKTLLREKYWKTLPGLFLSPMNIYNLLISKILSELVIFIVPLIIIFTFCFIIAEASLITIIFVLTIYVMSSLFMASIGLAIGSFRMSIESGYSMFFNIINLFLIFSCIRYPKEFFPANLHFLIVWNPFYYYWDLIRVFLVLGYENVIYSTEYTIHFIVVISLSFIFPMLSILFFNYIYKKYGLIGY